MAINPESQYPGKIAPSTPDYPFGAARNITLPGDGTGTPWEAALVNDLFGFQQSVLGRAGITPSGNPEKATESQYLAGLLALASVNAASVQTIGDIPEGLLVLGQSMNLVSWYPGGTEGGGLFFWAPAQSKSDHNGGSIISPSVPWEGVRNDFLDGTGETDPGGSGCWVRYGFEKLTVKMFGALGDGATDDIPAVQATIDAVNALGGGTVFFEKGIYFLTTSAGAVVFPTDNMTLQGAGRFESVLKMAAASASVIGVTAVDNVTIRDLGVDATNQTGGGHGIRVASADNCQMQNLHVAGGGGANYGIGLQDGAITNCLIENCLIEDTLSDSIDVKNKTDANENVVIRSVICRNFGIGNTNKAGLDLRGECQVSDVIIEAFGDGVNAYDGVRFRPGEVGDVNGEGAHRSELSNARISPSTKVNTTGLKIEARNCTVTNVVVKQANRGAVVSQSDNAISCCAFTNVNRGMEFNDPGFATKGDRTALSSIVCRSVTDEALLVQTDFNSFSGFTLRTCTDGINVGAGSTNNSFVCGSVTEFTGNSLIDNGANTRVVAVALVTDQ